MGNEKKYNSAGKLTAIIFNYKENLFEVEVNSETVTTNSESFGFKSNIGTVFEKHRIEKAGSTKDFAFDKEDEKIVQDFHNKFSSIGITEYEYVQVFLPKDEWRRGVLKQFAHTKFNGRNDYSSKFRKIVDCSSTDKSIEYDIFKSYFNYEVPEINKPLETLHVVDDTISRGRTIQVFIENLFDAGVIDESTDISASIIYNRCGSNQDDIFKGKNPLDMCR